VTRTVRTRGRNVRLHRPFSKTSLSMTPFPLRLACATRSALPHLAMILFAGLAPRSADAATPDQAVTLDAVKVAAQGEDESERARRQLARVPGAGNVIDLSQVADGRVAGTADVLAYQPGINAQSPGNEGVKVSIRGSGINRAPGAHASGISVSLDGLPLTFSGGTPYELLEPLWVSRVEVLRGANGLDRGALALGGAIDYISRSGLDSPGAELRLEGGSFGYRKGAWAWVRCRRSSTTTSA